MFKFRQSSSPDFDGNSTEDYNSDLDTTIVYNPPTPPAVPGGNSSIASNALVAPSSDPQDQTPTRSLPSPEEPMDMTKPIQDTPSPPHRKCYMGHLKGRANPHTGDFSACVSILQKNVCQDQVDEEFIHLNIVCKKWQPLNLKQKSHVTIRDLNDATEVPVEQDIPEWCIICPLTAS